MVDRVGVKTALAHCEFSDNSARCGAGAVYLDYGARPRMTDCRFQGNRSGCHGGGWLRSAAHRSWRARFPSCNAVRS